MGENGDISLYLSFPSVNHSSSGYYVGVQLVFLAEDFKVGLVGSTRPTHPPRPCESKDS